MAEIGVTRERATVADVVYERTGFRLSWGAIFAGFVVATALQMVLTTLGAAIGLTAYDPGQGDSASALGIGAAVWFAATALISMFIGGQTTGRLAGILTRGDGMLHGVIMWALSLLFAIYLASTGVGRLLGGVTDIFARTASSVVGGAVGSAGELGAAAAQGDVNVDITQQQQNQAQSAAQDVQQQVSQVGQQAGEVAGDAANVASKAAWTALLVMGLSVAAAAFGAGSKARE